MKRTLYNTIHEKEGPTKLEMNFAYKNYIRLLEFSSLNFPRLAKKWSNFQPWNTQPAHNERRIMLTLTDAAAHHLAALRAIPQFQPDKVVRFVLEGENVQMIADQKREGDIALKHQNTTILVFEETVSKELADLTLDLIRREGEERAKLVLKHSV
jgi:hypothetical protein